MESRISKAPRIVAVHLLNDYSGSPFVLRQALEALRDDGHQVHLFTATPGGSGFLSGISEVVTHTLFYRWSKNRYLTLAYFLFAQAMLFFKLLIFLKSKDTVYVNSILPFGAALAAKTRRCRVVYHIHETSVKPAALRGFLLKIASLSADECIYVSHFIRHEVQLQVPSRVVYNALPEKFTAIANRFRTELREKPRRILMLSSMKRYKGVQEFIATAKALPELEFTLVLNTSEDEMRAAFRYEELPSNLQLFSAQKNVHPFYQKADIVVNLSLPDQWIETFGMTILEAMTYGLPVIVPPVGGPAEIVRDGVEGFHIDSRNVSAIIDAIKHLTENSERYAIMANASLQKAASFNAEQFNKGICETFKTTESFEMVKSRIPKAA